MHFIVLNNKEIQFFFLNKCVMNIKMNKFITEIGRTTQRKFITFLFFNILFHNKQVSVVDCAAFIYMLN